jgi:hypothetical protein
VGYDGLDAALLEPSSQAVSVVGFVRQQSPWGGDGAQKRNGHSYVGDVSRGQRESDRSAAIIGQCMDFARSSTS